METNMPQVQNGDSTTFLERAGFDERAIARIRAIKQRHAEGEFSDLTPEAKRLEFVRWLYLNGRIQP